VKNNVLMVDNIAGTVKCLLAESSFPC